MSEASSRSARIRLIKFAFGTMVCLLVILGVVALINAVGMKTPRKATTLATATALESAANSFYTEYGALPDVGSRVTTGTPEGVRLLEILLGLENSDKPQNRHRIKFLSVKEGKNQRNGLIYNAAGNRPEGLFDKWGNPFTVELDLEYKEQLSFIVGTAAVNLNGRRAAVYSPGPDKKLGTADDIKTW